MAGTTAVVPSPSMEIQASPHMVKKIAGYTRDLYNYDETSKTTKVSVELFKSKENDLEKMKFILNNFKVTVLDLAAFVKEVHEKRFNDQKSMQNASLGLMVSTSLFVSMIYIVQVKKVVLATFPIFGNLYEMVEGIYERDFLKIVEAFEKICDELLSAESTSIFCITDGSENKEKIESKEAEAKVEKTNEEKEETAVKSDTPSSLKKAEKIEITLVEDPVQDDLPKDRL